MERWPAGPKAQLARCRGLWNDELNRQEAEQKVQSTLYHYTDAAGLHGIITTQHIWLTSMRHLNDPAELHYGWEVAQEVLRDFAQPRGEYVQHLCKNFEQGFPNLFKIFGYFTASFSRNADDLSQWRAYGHNGQGFALGFAAHLFHVEPLRPEQQLPEKAWVANVIYGARQAKDLLRPAITRIMETAAETDAFEREEDALDFISECWMELSFALSWYSLQAKQEAYRHEQETRLMLQAHLRDLQPHIKVRPRGVSLMPYIAHPFPVKLPGSLVEIVIGPTADDCAEDGLDMFLRAEGLEGIAIRRSDIRYRG